MSERDDQGMALLTADVLATEGPDADLMVRYAQSPDALSENERSEVEAYLASSPGARDTLRVLQQFEPPPRPAAAETGPGVGARLRGWLSGPGRWLPAAAATAAAVAVVFALLPGGNLPSYIRPPASLPRATGTIQTRGGSAAELRALAPDHVGHTASDRPTLLYYLAPLPAAPRMRLELRDVEGGAPMSRELAPPAAPGLHRISLAELGLQLEPDREYAWSVVLGPSAETSTTATGFIRFTAPPEAVAERFARGASDARPRLYAKYSYWYDAAAAITEAGDGDTRALLDSLLEQGGSPILPPK